MDNGTSEISLGLVNFPPAVSSSSVVKIGDIKDKGKVNGAVPLDLANFPSAVGSSSATEMKGRKTLHETKPSSRGGKHLAIVAIALIGIGGLFYLPVKGGIRACSHPSLPPVVAIHGRQSQLPLQSQSDAPVNQDTSNGETILVKQKSGSNFSKLSQKPTGETSLTNQTEDEENHQRIMKIFFYS